MLTRLAPTAIILPSYFVLADIVLVAQCVYYNRLNKRRAEALQRDQDEANEDSPLLRRSSSYRSRDAEDALPAGKADEAAAPTSGSLWARNAASLIAVYVVGIVAWFISFKAGAWNVGDDPSDAVGTPGDEEENPWEILGLALGYVSAVCYLWYGPFRWYSGGVFADTDYSARIPQIIKNYREKSCEGTSRSGSLLDE